MDLTLFVIFLSLSLFLVFLGFYRSDHSELALIGFLFLFLLSLMILNSNIEYKTGTTTNITYSYDPTNSTLLSSQEIVTDNYSTFTANDSLSFIGKTLAHLFGIWLAVASVVGFIGILLGIKKQKW